MQLCNQFVWSVKMWPWFELWLLRSVYTQRHSMNSPVQVKQSFLCTEQRWQLNLFFVYYQVLCCTKAVWSTWKRWDSSLGIPNAGWFLTGNVVNNLCQKFLLQWFSCYAIPVARYENHVARDAIDSHHVLITQEMICYSSGNLLLSSTVQRG